MVHVRLSAAQNVTVDFTSDGTPVAVAAGNLWFVYMLHRLQYKCG